MNDRRSFLGFAVTAIGIAAVPVIGGAQLAGSDPALVTDRASSGSPRYRKRRPSTVSPGTSFEALPPGGSPSTRGHPRRAAREQDGLATAPEVSLAEVDTEEVSGRDGRGARATFR